jgi:hypothetical protein
MQPRTIETGPGYTGRARAERLADGGAPPEGC